MDLGGQWPPPPSVILQISTQPTMCQAHSRHEGHGVLGLAWEPSGVWPTVLQPRFLHSPPTRPNAKLLPPPATSSRPHHDLSSPWESLGHRHRQGHLSSSRAPQKPWGLAHRRWYLVKFVAWTNFLALGFTSHPSLYSCLILFIIFPSIKDECKYRCK